MGGCASTWSAQSGQLDEVAGFGEANKQTFAAMIVNPDPVYDTPLETSAESAAEAAERVRLRQVVQPQAEDTTSVGSGGGGGGG
ncbi:hypothetical protein AAW00_13795 [Aurantiacibacter luteus]|uniref:Uncharacterized protein n=1 Tax=Aurantiacibacter luteus TaxID=1581420 RepID=A0A0G9MKS6_9SPHN|nr:hypothetical protein AAW00_13795 [Aurantiacibacter luteus]